MPSHGTVLSADDDAARNAMIASLREHVGGHAFPCVGAKSAMATGQLRIETARSITSGWNDLYLHDALTQWSKRYEQEPEGLRSLAVVFAGPLDLTEPEFETAMWERLASLSAKDEWRGHGYDPQVSSDPSDPHFSLSFGGRAYFVVGMHPGASRAARQTPFPTMVFNLHDQFEALRASERYERMRAAILKRDEALDGSVNPMLARHGTVSEARQYSGRQVGADWKCPFTGQRNSK